MCLNVNGFRRSLIVTALLAAFAGSALGQSVLHKYNLDEDGIANNATAADAVGSLQGTYLGGVSSASGFGGVPNRAAHFDGVNGRVQLGDPAVWNLNIGHLPNATVAAWIKVDSGYLGRYREIYSEGATWDPFNRPMFQMFLDPQGKLQFGFIIAGTGEWTMAVVTNTPVLDPNRWYLVAGTASSTGGKSAYIFDDTLQLLGSANNPNTTSINGSTFHRYIGAGYSTPGIFDGFPFLGSIQDATFFDYALTQAQLQALPLPTSSACYVPPPNMVSWWAGDGNAFDVQGVNNAAVVGGATYASGKVGQAFSFNGSSAYVNAGNAATLQISAGDFTVDAWVKLTNVTGDRAIVDKMATTGVHNSDGWRLLLQADGKFWFCFGAAGNGCQPAISTTVRGTTTVQPDVWYHVAGVKSAGTISIYVDGALEASNTMGSFVDTHNANLLIGGNVQYSAYFAGLIDEVEIFNRALSGTEIAAIFNAGQLGKCKPAAGAATSLAVSSASGLYGGNATLQATLTSAGSPVIGRSIDFTLNGNSVGSATTDDSGVATLNNASLSGINADTYASGVDASFTGDFSFAASDATPAQLIVSLADQTIDFASLPDKTFGDADFAVNATASSGLAVSFTATGNCSIVSGTTIHLTGTGSCTVTAHQNGDANHNAAPDVQRGFNIAQAGQTITVTTAAPESAVYGATFPVAATASSTLAVAITATGACSLSAGTVAMTSGTGSCEVHYNQAGDSNYNAALEITSTTTATKAAQTIAFAPLPNRKLSQSPFNVAATSSSGLAVNFTTLTPAVCTSGGTDGATITLIATGNCTLSAHQIGNNNYSAALDVNQTFNVGNGKVDQTIAFGALPGRTMLQSPFQVSATASSGLTVKFTAITTSVCTSSGPGGATITLIATGTCTVQADQGGNAAYNPAPPVLQSFTVTKVAQTITFGALANRSLAQSPFSVTATASSGLAVAFTTTTPAVCTSGGKNGATIKLLAVGTCTVRADQVGNNIYNPAASVPQSMSVTP